MSLNYIWFFWFFSLHLCSNYYRKQIATPLQVTWQDFRPWEVQWRSTPPFRPAVAWGDVDTLWAALDNGRGGFITAAGSKNLWEKRPWLFLVGSYISICGKIVGSILCLEVGTPTCDLWLVIKNLKQVYIFDQGHGSINVDFFFGGDNVHFTICVCVCFFIANLHTCTVHIRTYPEPNLQVDDIKMPMRAWGPCFCFVPTSSRNVMDVVGNYCTPFVHRSLYHKQNSSFSVQ